MASVGSLFASLTLQSAAFNSGMQRARRTASQAQGALDKNFSSMESRGKKAFAAIAAAGAGFTLGAVLKSIADTNTEFQRLMGQLTTATGSMGAAAGQMQMLQKIAATTPFALNQVTEAYVKLRNMGLTASERALISYGNTASSMGKDIMQFIEAVADAATGEFERLKEFGIKASKEKDKVALTFRGVTTEIGNSADEIEKYLMRLGEVQFAGAMARQSATLGGALSNLGDTFDQLAVRFGEAGFAPALESAIRGLGEATVSVESFAETLGWLTGTAIGYAVTGITALIENIDTLVNILGVVAVAKIGLFAAAMGRQAVVALTAFRTATVQAGIAATLMGGQLTASAAKSAAAMSLLGRAAGGAMAFLGGPVGVAITGISVALGIMGVASLKAAAQQSMLSNSIAEGTRRREEAETMARALRAQTDDLSSAERKALTDTANLTGQVHLLATAYGRAALEAKRAAIEISRAQAVKARSDYADAVRARNASAKANGRNIAAMRGAAGGFISGGGLTPGGMVGGAGGAVKGWLNPAEAMADPTLEKEVAEARRNAEYQAWNYRRERNADATDFLPEVAPTASAAGAAGRGAGGPKVDPNDALRDRHEFESRQRQLNLDILRSQEQLAHDYVERFKITSDMLDIEIAQRNADLDIQLATKQITGEQHASLKAMYERRDAIERQAVQENYAYERAREAVQFRDDELRRAAEAAQLDAQMATTARERRAAELRLLEIRKQQERAALQAVIDDTRASYADKQDATARMGDLNGRFAKEAENIRAQTMGPLEAFMASIPQSAEQMNEALEFVAANGLKSVEDGIVDAITGAKSLADAFTDVANSIIKDLMRILVQKYIMEGLTNVVSSVLGGGASFAAPMASAGAGLSSAGSSISGAFAGFRAAGGPVSEGKTYIVGEKGPEVFTATRSGRIVPNHRSGGGSPINISVDARGATNPAEVEAAATRAIMRATPLIVEQATANTLRKAARPRMN